MDIRQASLADLDLVAPLFDAYRVFYGQPADLPRARTFLADKLEHARSTIFLAFTEDGPAGFTQLYPTFSSVRTQPALILNELYVTPAA